MDLILRASLALLGFLTPLVSATATPVPTSEPPTDAAPADPTPTPGADASQSETTQPPSTEPPATDPSTTQPATTASQGADETPPPTDPAASAPPTSDGAPPAEAEGGAGPCPTAPDSAPVSDPTSTTATVPGADPAGDPGGETAGETPSPADPASETPAPTETTVATETTVEAACDPTPTTAGGETTTVPANPSNPDGAGSESTTTTVPVDPLANEKPPEEVPDTDETVPAPGGAYAGQGGFQPAEVLWSSVKAAETKLVEARLVQEERIDAVRQIRRQHKELRVAQRSLGDEARQAAAEISDAQTLLTERAVAAFVNDDALSNAVIGSFDAADHDQILELRGPAAPPRHGARSGRGRDPGLFGAS